MVVIPLGFGTAGLPLLSFTDALAVGGAIMSVVGYGFGLVQFVSLLKKDTAFDRIQAIDHAWDLLVRARPTPPTKTD